MRCANRGPVRSRRSGRAGGAPIAWGRRHAVLPPGGGPNAHMPFEHAHRGGCDQVAFHRTRGGVHYTEYHIRLIRHADRADTAVHERSANETSRLALLQKKQNPPQKSKTEVPKKAKPPQLQINGIGAADLDSFFFLARPGRGVPFEG